MIRRIESQADIERKKKRNNIILSSIMLGILVLSSLGFAFITGGPNTDSSNSKNNNVNNGQNQKHSGTDKISFQYGGNNINLLSSYNDVQNVSADTTIRAEDYYGKVLYFVGDNQGILNEITSNLGRFSSRVQEACYGKCNKNLPEKNCTSSDKIIIWNESIENKVYQNESCVFIEGDMRAADAFIYKLFGSP